MSYSVVQLPFFVCITVLLKFATAAGRVITISLAALAGFVVNVGAGLFIMRYMGVGGIALGASLSVMVSTVLLLVAHARSGYVTGLDTVLMLLNWFLFVTLLMCLHFDSLPGITVTILAFVVLTGGYLNSLRPRFSKAAILS